MRIKSRPRWLHYEEVTVFHHLWKHVRRLLMKKEMEITRRDMRMSMAEFLCPERKGIA